MLRRNVSLTRYDGFDNSLPVVSLKGNRARWSKDDRSGALVRSGHASRSNNTTKLSLVRSLSRFAPFRGRVIGTEEWIVIPGSNKLCCSQPFKLQISIARNLSDYRQADNGGELK